MEKRKKLLQELLLVIIVVAVMLALFVWYTVQNRHRIEARNMDYAADSARLTGYRVDEEMTYALTLINTYAEFIGKSLGTSDLSAAQLQEMKENSIFDVIIFCDKEGVDHNADGRTADATERGFYKKGMTGQSGMSIVFNSPFYDETMLNFYAPVYHDGEIQGIIRGVFLAEEYLQDLLSTTYFGESAGVYLCMKDGRVIAGSDSSAQRQNVIELLTRENIIDEEAAAGVQGVFDSGSGEGAFVCDEDCQTDNVCVMFLPESGYALVQTFPKTVTQGMISDANLSGIRLEGPFIAPKESSDIISDGISFGSIQVPSHGKPIILLSDRQTTGGYAKIATVASVDIPKLVQRKTDHKIRFKAITVQEAQKLYLDEVKELDEMRKEIHQPCKEVLECRLVTKRLRTLFE